MAKSPRRSTVPSDSKVRSHLALITAMAFFGGPVLALLVLLLGVISPPISTPS